MVRIGNVNDTVSIWPRLTFEFSTQLKDSSVNIKIIPEPHQGYSCYLNNTKDTLTLTVTGFLEGNTHYTITLAGVITAQNGEHLYPEDVLFDIFTMPGEKEPNNTKKNADTIATVCFGTVYPANDTDFFYVPTAVGKGLYLKSHENKSGYAIMDLSSTVIAINNSYDEIKTITFSQNISPPLFIYIFSLLDNDSRYELGTVY